MSEKQEKAKRRRAETQRAIQSGVTRQAAAKAAARSNPEAIELDPREASLYTRLVHLDRKLSETVMDFLDQIGDLQIQVSQALDAFQTHVVRKRGLDQKDDTQMPGDDMPRPLPTGAQDARMRFYNELVKPMQEKRVRSNGVRVDFTDGEMNQAQATLDVDRVVAGPENAQWRVSLGVFLRTESGEMEPLTSCENTLADPWDAFMACWQAVAVDLEGEPAVMTSLVSELRPFLPDVVGNASPPEKTVPEKPPVVQ